MMTQSFVSAFIYIHRRKKLPSIERIRYKFAKRSPNMPIPFSAYVEPTTKCNSECKTCSRKKLKPSRLNKDLDMGAFREILRQIPLERINLQGLGEPLLCRNLWEICEYAKSIGIFLETTTNGTLINDENAELIARYFDNICVSLDSLDKDNYFNIRHNDLEKAFEGIGVLQSHLDRPVFINTVLSSLNIHEIGNIEKWCSENKLRFGVAPVQNWHIPTEPEYESTQRFVKESRSLCSELGYPTEPWKKVCMAPFKRPFMTFDGYVTPCCIRMNPEVVNFGNMFETPFGDIWNGEKIVSFRKCMICDTSNLCCDTCPI